MFGELIGKIVSAPARIVSLPLRAINVMLDDEPKDNMMDDIADGTEEVIKKILDD